jgi:hypothetical protein
MAQYKMSRKGTIFFRTDQIKESFFKKKRTFLIYALYNNQKAAAHTGGGINN